MKIRAVQNNIGMSDEAIIFNDLWPQKWIPGQILILLDPHNLSVCQN